MKRLLFLLLALTCVAQISSAQNVDSLGIRPQKPLPPSILSELRRAEHNRTLVFHDTVKAADIERQHAADTGAAGTYADSAITLLDTAVSLSHKEWLDSELVEIPELHRVGSRVHYEYPPSIMTESEMSKVAFDSTILLRMNPLSHEQLPFFDQSPIPMPLPQPKPFEAFLEVGGGNHKQPLVRGFAQQRLSPRIAVSADADYESHSSLPITSYFNVGGKLKASLGDDPALRTNVSSKLTGFLNYNTRGVKLLNDSGKTRTMSLIGLGAAIDGNVDQLHYAVSASDRQWNEDLFPNNGEATQDIVARADLNIGATYAFGADLSYSRASLSDSSAQDADRVAIRFGTNQNATLAWNAGIAMLGGTGASSMISPIANVRFAFNPRWEFGVSLDPRASLSSMTTLTATNPFYRSLSGRGSVVDKLNLLGYMTYALSADDNLRAEVHYTTRDHEPVFESRALSDSSITQIAIPASTQRLAVTGAGNFLLFARDVLTASLTLQTATNADSNRTLAYEPTMQFEAAYRLNSVAENIHPLARVRMIVLPSHTLNMLDLEVDANVWKNVSAKLALDNILDGRSDYWEGYNETPRSVSITVRYGF